VLANLPRKVAISAGLALVTVILAFPYYWRMCPYQSRLSVQFVYFSQQLFSVRLDGLQTRECASQITFSPVWDVSFKTNRTSEAVPGLPWASKYYRSGPDWTMAIAEFFVVSLGAFILLTVRDQRRNGSSGTGPVEDFKKKHATLKLS